MPFFCHTLKLFNAFDIVKCKHLHFPPNLFLAISWCSNRPSGSSLLLKDDIFSSFYSTCCWAHSDINDLEGDTSLTRSTCYVRARRIVWFYTCILFLRSSRCNVLSPCLLPGCSSCTKSRGWRVWDGSESRQQISCLVPSATLQGDLLDGYLSGLGGGGRCNHYSYLLVLVYLFFIKYYYSYVLESLLFIHDTKDFNERWLSGRMPVSQSRKPGFWVPYATVSKVNIRSYLFFNKYLLFTNFHPRLLYRLFKHHQNTCIVIWQYWLKRTPATTYGGTF